MLWVRFLASLRYLCLIYFAVIALGLGLSLLLPSFGSLKHMPETLDQTCYWTNAMVVFVECGARVPGGTMREVIYNLWLYLIYFPMFVLWLSFGPAAVAATGALYAPFFAFFILSTKLRKIRQAS
jgi:hypothetical protein